MSELSYRDINRLISEKVFNYTLIADHGNVYWVDSDRNEPDHGTDYAYELKDAWEIVKFLRNPKRVFCLSTAVDYRSDGPHLLWIAKWEMHDPDYRFEFQFHESETMAICLASLKAVGVKVD